MKIIKTVFLVIFLALISISSVKAEHNPPKPTMNSAGSANKVAADDVPPAPDGEELPIDTNIVFLLFAGLSIGVTVVYKNKIKKSFNLNEGTEKHPLF